MPCPALYDHPVHLHPPASSFQGTASAAKVTSIEDPPRSSAPTVPLLPPPDCSVPVREQRRARPAAHVSGKLTSTASCTTSQYGHTRLDYLHMPTQTRTRQVVERDPAVHALVGSADDAHPGGVEPEGAGPKDRAAAVQQPRLLLVAAERQQAKQGRGCNVCNTWQCGSCVDTQMSRFMLQQASNACTSTVVQQASDAALAPHLSLRRPAVPKRNTGVRGRCERGTTASAHSSSGPARRIQGRSEKHHSVPQVCTNQPTMTKAAKWS